MEPLMTLYKVAPTLESVGEMTIQMTIQMKATEEFFNLV